MNADYVPGSLFSHPAWLSWKEAQGWRQILAGHDLPLLLQKVAPLGSMAYAPGRLPDCDAAHEEPGRLIEALAERARACLPEDCAFIRWDLNSAVWADTEGMPLSRHLQELRMNASTRDRRIRKAAAERSCPDTMVVDLTGGEAAVVSRMDSRTRYSVRLAARRGTRVERTGKEGLGAFHSLHTCTAELRRLPSYPESLFRFFFDAAEAYGLGLDLYLALSADEPAAAAIIARHGGDAWYLFAASSPAHRAAAGPSAILHRALLDCAADGDRRMDLLGVGPPGVSCHPLSGLSLFKAGFGGVRRTRAGAWDYVLRPEAYEDYAQAELMSMR